MTAPDPRLGEIEGRLSKATPGPWFEEFVELVPGDGEGEWIVNSEPNFICSTHYRDERCRNDAEFIAAAPADVAYLLAELRKAQDALGRVEGEVSMWERDDQEHLATFGQHLPCSIVIPAERLRAAVAAATGGERG